MTEPKKPTNREGKEKIGLFGGTFNPIHSGHIKAACVVRDQFMLDRILFIPSSIPPHKDSQAIVSPEIRLHMVKLALENYPEFFASSIEIDGEGTSYSILTLKKLKKIYPGSSLYFILGIDAFLEIETWKDYEKVLELCHFVVISRPGYCLEEARMVLGGKYAERTYTLSEKENSGIDPGEGFKIFLLSFEAMDVASTEIRNRLRRRQSIAGLVPDSVAAHIVKNKLYQ